MVMIGQFVLGQKVGLGAPETWFCGPAQCADSVIQLG